MGPDERHEEVTGCLWMKEASETELSLTGPASEILVQLKGNGSPLIVQTICQACVRLVILLEEPGAASKWSALRFFEVAMKVAECKRGQLATVCFSMRL